MVIKFFHLMALLLELSTFPAGLRNFSYLQPAISARAGVYSAICTNYYHQNDSSSCERESGNHLPALRKDIALLCVSPGKVKVTFRLGRRF